MSTALQQLLERAAARKAAAASTLPALPTLPTLPVPTNAGGAIVLNAEQQAFVNLAATRNNAVLIGAAGTGKTTCMREAVAAIALQAPALSGSHRHLKDGTPGVVLVSFTRRAVTNLRKAVSAEMKGNCITIHKLLEYAPVPCEVQDPATGEWRNSMRFMPSRNAHNPLNHSLVTVIIDESSMVSTELYQQLCDALPHKVQFIFLGDINQLPPVFGSAVLGYKMLEHPVVELTQVYRQALESPIIRLAHRILSGNPIPASEYDEWNFPNQLKIHPWKKRISADNALHTLAKFFKDAFDNQQYDPAEDMILIPFNKSCGTIELNKHIATHLARKRQAEVHEILAGFDKHYLAVGDRILYDKEDAIVTAIKPNDLFSRHHTLQQPSVHLDYWGCMQEQHKQHHLTTNTTDVDDVDILLSACVADPEERIKQASHTITVQLLETEQTVTLSAAAEINSILLGYALTVHKSQGSEWRKVFVCLHHSHATMTQRELLYTACTRARQELYVICEPDTFTRGILNQKIKGNTLAEKAEYFKGKKQSN